MRLHFLRERERKMSDCSLRTIAVTCLDAWRHADQTSGARWQTSVHISFVDQTVCLLSTHESIYPSDQYSPPSPLLIPIHLRINRMRRFPKDPSVLWNMKQGVQYLNMKINHMLMTALELKCDPSKEGLDVDLTMWSRARKR